MGDAVLWPVPQNGLKLIGGGSAAFVYEVNKDIVIKACHTYRSPAKNAPGRDWWEFADATLFSLYLNRQERIMLRLLQKLPHPNIVDVIAVDENEGMYLRRYLPLSQVEQPAQRGRMLWYRDLLRGLCHLHGLGVCHSDLRLDNILFSQARHSRAVLCDFSKASQFGELNTVPNVREPVPRTGLAETVSDKTDRFALACLVFEMETGSKPALAATPDGQLSLPPVAVGHDGLASIVTKAWFGQYISTADMLAETEALLECDGYADQYAEPAGQLDILRQQTRQWRQERLDNYGSVVNGLITDDDELDKLARLCRWEDKWW